MPAAAEQVPRSGHWFTPWRWKRRWIVALLLVVFVGYPLSIGPVYRMVHDGWLPESALRLYRPFFLMAWYSEPANYLLYGYLEWFVPSERPS